MLNHKTIKTILLALCLVSLAGAGEPTFEFKYSEEEAQLYRMPIKQITPKDGIWTGHVIAYGHYIKPPYKIEVKDTIVLINGVQVYPALKTPGMIEKEQKDKEREEARKKEMTEYIKSHQDEYNEMRRTDSLAKLVYEKEKASKGKEAAINAVAEIYRKSAGVDSVRVFGPNSGGLLVCYSPGTIQYELLRIDGFSCPTHRYLDFEPPGITTSPPLYKTQEERDEAMKKMGFPTTKQGWAELWAKRYEETLLEGRAQIFCANSPGRGLLSEQELTFIFNILKDSKKIPKEKYRALMNLRKLAHDGIMSLLTNFVQQEWKHIGRRK